VGFPTTQIYIAFNDGPYVASPTWTEVTTYARQINIQRGRQDEQSDFESGNATVVLDNRSRIFDPFYTSGTYYGKLLPRRQIKIEATISSVVYPVFRGFIEGWPVSITDAGYDTTVTVQCFDALGLLADEEMPDDPADYYIRSLNPRHYWPLNDPIDPQNYANTRLADFGNTPQTLSAAAGLRTSNAEGLAVALPNTSCNLSETEFIEGWYFATSGTSNAVTTMTQWCVLGSGDVNYIFSVYGMSHEVELAFDKTNNQLSIFTYDGNVQNTYTATVYPDVNIPHHWAIVTNGNATINTVYLDGLTVAVTFVSTVAFPVSRLEKFGVTPGRHQQAILTNTGLTATEIRNIYSLSLGYITEGTVARFNRVIGYTPFPASLTSTPSASYSATLSEISTGGPPITDELQTISNSEGGNLFVSRNGTLTLTSRSAIFQGTSFTSQASFGGAGISIGTELTYRLDDKNLRNTLAVGYSGDGSVETSNAASITAYGTAGGSWSTQLSSVDDAETLGELLVAFSATPAVVIDPLQVNVSATDASWTTILGLELLNRITLNIVQQVGATITQSQILQSIEHTITPDRWITTINGSVRFTNVFTIGTSLIGGPDLLS
jgi:hypothetical protein